MSTISPQSDPADETTDAPAVSAAAARTRWRFGRRPTSVSTLPRSLHTEIETPAPQGVQRDPPAGDVDERGNRTLWRHVDDRQAAARGRAEAINMLMLKKAAARILVGEEARRRSEITSLVAGLSEQRDELAALGDPLALIPDRSRDAAILRLRHRRLQHAIRGREQTIRRVKSKLDTVSMQIESLPDTIEDRLAAIIALQDHDQEVRSSGRRDLEGPWQEPGLNLPPWGRHSFEERFGPLAVGERDELVAYIAALRACVQRNAEELETTW